MMLRKDLLFYAAVALCSSAVSYGQQASEHAQMKAVDHGFYLLNNAGTNYVLLQAPAALGNNVVLTMPSSEGDPGQVLQTNGDGELSWISALTNPMLITGDMVYSGDNLGTPSRLPGNVTTTKNFLTSTGNGSNASAPAWGTIAAGDVPSTLNGTTFNAAITVGGNTTSDPNMGTISSVSLNAYYEGSFTASFSSPSSFNWTFNYVRVGKQVTLYWPTQSKTCNGSQYFASAGAVVPGALVPTTSLDAPVFVTSGGVAQAAPGRLVLLSGGGIQVTLSFATTNFASGNCIVNGGTYSYILN